MARVRRRPLRAELARRWPELEADSLNLIRSGNVLVDGLVRTNPETVVDETSSIRVVGEPRPFRGYEKLAHALREFGVAVEGKVALDAGAAAGGFTQALLDSGARKVYAVEVGFGQLLGSLRQDARVVNLERTNIGSLDRTLVPDPLDVVTLDLGYLALSIGVPQLNVLAYNDGARLIALVKPVAELGLSELPTHPGAVRSAAERAAAGIEAAGWSVSRWIESPVRGARGAAEALLDARRAAPG